MRLYITGLAKIIMELRRTIERQEKFSKGNPLGRKLLVEFEGEFRSALALDNSNVKAVLKYI